MFIKYFLLITILLLSFVQGSFPTEEALNCGFEEAKNHPGFGATVLVIDKKDCTIMTSNGVCIEPGKIITHNHVSAPDETWVISLREGADLPVIINCNLMSYSETKFNYIFVNLERLRERNPELCRIVRKTSSPDFLISDRSREIMFSPENFTFIQGHEKHCEFLRDAATEPLRIGNTSTCVSSDYRLLDIEPFPDQPFVGLCSEVYSNQSGEFPVTILGASLYTHLHNGNGFSFLPYLTDAIQSILFENPTLSGPRAVFFDLKVSLTSFSQVVCPIGSKLVADAVSYSDANKTCVKEDELWDPSRTNSGITGLIVEGLSGCGVYNGSGELVAIASSAYQHPFTKEIRNEFTQAIKKRDAEAASEIFPYLPKNVSHSLLNIHQIIPPDILSKEGA